MPYRLWKIALARRAATIASIGLASMALLTTAWWVFGRSHDAPEDARTSAARDPGKKDNLRVHSDARGELREPQALEVRLGEKQQRLIGLRIERITLGNSHEVLTAPGRLAPDETRFAQITPRAAGVIRTVNAVIGQEVRAGEVLATVDSPEVGRARLDLHTQYQSLEMARARAAWQETVYNNALELAKSLQRGESPEEIHRRFEHRAVGEERQKLMSAYTHYRLAEASYARKRELFNQKIIMELPLHEARAQFEVDLASYQALMDQIEYQTKLSLTQARQTLHQAETSVRVAREQLRILGVRAGEGGIEPLTIQAEIGPPGTTLNALENPGGVMAMPARGGEKERIQTEAIQSVDGRMVVEETPVSAYALRAPFDGTILERESIVPGVYVDTTHRLFTLANLSSVWVEANVHESDFGLLSGSRGGRVRFRSPAYPDREFEGEVIYTGDLVEEKSHAVKLLARADNPERLLKPGMFVEVKILHRDPRPVVQIPASALLTEGESTFAYVRSGPDRFERRDVVTVDAEGGRVKVRRGLKPGDEVVVEGGYKIKAEAMRLASSQ